jgi:hypothetical protein
MSLDYRSKKREKTILLIYLTGRYKSRKKLLLIISWLMDSDRGGSRK